VSLKSKISYDCCRLLVLMLILRRKQHIKDLQERLAKVESLLPRATSTAIQVEKRQAGQSGGLSLAAAASPSQPLTSLSPKQNVTTVTVNTSDIKALIDEDAPTSSNIFETLGRFWEQVSHRIRTHIPSSTFSVQEPEIIFLLLTIEDICKDLPLLDIPSFKARLRCQHTLETCDDPSWWACINSLIAIAISRRMVNRSFYQMSALVWTFFRNAYKVFSDVVAQADGVMEVQALLAIVMFMGNSADSRTTSLLLSTTSKVLQTINLSTDSQKSSPEIVLYERLYWIAFILEVESNFGYGTHMMTSDDLDIALPKGSFQRDTGIIDLECEHTDSNIFRLRAELALIQSQIQERLYSTQSSKQLGDQLLPTIEALQHELEKWRSTIPPKFRPQLDHSLQDPTTDTRVISLHFTYFHCVSLIQWASRTYNSQSINQYKEAARCKIALLTSMPFPQILGGLW
jgi:hypothetical protein